MGRLLSWTLISTCLIAGLLVSPLLVQAAEDPDDIFDLETESTSEDDYEDVDDANKAYVLVRKSLPEPPRVVQGSNVTVTVEVYNAGKSSAKAVSAVDSISEGFQLIEGKTSLSADSLAPGASSSFVYTVVAKAAGLVYMPPVQVKYVSADDDSKLSTSSLPQPLQVMTSTENIIAMALRAGSYLSFGSIQSIDQWLNVAYAVGGFTVLLVLLYGYNALRSANKRWKYQRALKEVEKMQ